MNKVNMEVATALKTQAEGLSERFKGKVVFSIVPKSKIAENGEYNLSASRYLINDEKLKIKNYELSCPK
jgi:hypothetical protein